MVAQRAHIIVQGQVQGVGFRYFTSKAAKQLGLTGWVKNKEDGSVELEVEGEESAIQQFTQTLTRKHPWARIDNMETQWKPYEGSYQNFEITY